MDIKQVWKEAKTSTSVSEEELWEITHRNSNGILQKIKRKMLWEEVLNAIGFIAIVAYLFYSEKLVIGLAATVIGLASMVYLNRIYLKVRRISYQEDTIHFLGKIHDNLKEFIRMYAWGIYALGATGFITGLYIGDHFDENDSMGFPVFILIIAIFIFPIYLLLKWITHLMYGRDLKKIKKLMSALDGNGSM